MSKFHPADLKSMYEEIPCKTNYTGIYDPEYFWDEYGKAYLNTFSSNGKGTGFDLNIQSILSRIQEIKPKTVLEVGCGFGRNFPYIKANLKCVERLVGIELSKTMIDSSCKYFSMFKEKIDVTLIQGDAKSLPFKDNEFDLIFTHVCLTHIPPKFIPQVTKEISRVAKKWIIHIERWNYLYEHPNNHRWSHCLPPYYRDLGWELWENDVINSDHKTNAITFRKF